MAYKGTRAKAGIKAGDSMAVQKQKWVDYGVEKATGADTQVAMRLDSKKATEARKSQQKSAKASRSTEQKISDRRAEQAANPEKFQSVLKNKKAVTKKLGNMGQGYKGVDRVVKADRDNRRAANPNADSFRGAQKAAMTRAAKPKSTGMTAADRKKANAAVAERKAVNAAFIKEMMANQKRANASVRAR